MAKPSTRFLGGVLRSQLSYGLNPSKPSSPNVGFFSRISSPSMKDALNPAPCHSASALLSRSYVSKGLISETLTELSSVPVLPQSILHRNYFSPSSSSSVYSKYQLPIPQGHSRLPFAFSPRTLIGVGKVSPNSFRVRLFSSRITDTGKVRGKFAKTVFDRPASAVRSAFARYQEAIGLQIDAFWKRNYLVMLGAGGFVVCAFLWRVMFGIANTFVGFSEGMAKYGFLALSAAMVTLAGLYFRSRFTINPDRVYRIAMRRLNTSAGILEVMGAPLTGTDLRAYVMSGGGLMLKKFRPTLRSKRCFLIFPIQGAERKGLVSVEVKKKKGQYDMKLLAVDIPMATGHDQRLFVLGNEDEYKVGGGLISELRDPVVKAMAATKEFEDLDQIEDEQDAERELQEAERKRREEVEALEKGGPA